MPVNSKYICPFIPNAFIHICCKSVDGVPLFRNDNNRLYFLKKYAAYTKGYAETYCYILLDNHAHFLVGCPDEDMLTSFLKSIPSRKLKSHQYQYINKKISFEQAMEFQYKDFFVCYARSYNNMFARQGALFTNPFRRIHVKNNTHFTTLIVYLHANMVKHGISTNFQHYAWSSYKAMLSEGPTLLKRKEVLEWFGSRENFINTHQTLVDLYYANPYSME